jgi:O-antigen/teichoic acid export membrane protein
MNKQSGLLVGSTLIFISSLITFSAKFGTSVIVARTLGPEGKGVYNLTLLVGSLLVLIINLGISGSLTYLIASKKYEISQLFSFAVISAIFLGGIGGIVFYFPYEIFLKNNFLAGTDTSQVTLVLIFIPVILFTSYLSSILLGQQQIIAYNVVDIVRAIANLLLQGISAFLGKGVSGAIVAWIVANVIALATAILFLRPHISLKLLQLRSILHSSLSFGIKNYIANLLNFFNYRLDSVLVNYFSGPANVGLYSTGVGMAELIWYIPNAVSGALFPKISTLDPKTANQLTSRTCRQVLLITLISAVGLSLVGPILIPWVYTDKFQGSVSPFLWLLPGIVGMSISKVISADLAGRGKPQYGTYTSTITVLGTIILDIALIPAYGIVGAAIASSIAYIASSILSVIWFTKESHTTWIQVVIPTRFDIQYLTQKGYDTASKLIAMLKQY